MTSRAAWSRRQFIAGAGGAIGGAALGGAPGWAQSLSCSQVVVGTWGGDYEALLGSNIHEPLVAPQKIDVLTDVGDQNVRKAKLRAEHGSKRGSMDVACLGDADMYEMNQQGMFQELDPKAIPNVANVLPKLRKSYAVPHIYSGKVIVYNSDKVKPAPTSYADLWDPKFRDKVGLVDIFYFQNLECAALVAGGDAHNYEPGKAKLMELKKLGCKLYPSNETLAAGLKAEEIWITIMWRARAVQWKNAGIPVASAVPKEGATPIVFEMAIPKNAPEPQCGMRYLDAALDAKAQVGFAKTMGYVPTVANATLPPELKAALDFSPAEQENFFIPDFGYIAKNNAQWLDWWNKEFKA
jgi:putative spermidine/putrescine transport system substrate-binding protein